MMSDATTTSFDQPADDPVWSVTLWPHRSLEPRQFRIFMAIIAAMLCVPLIPILGASAAWVIGAFLLADFLLLYGMIKLTYRSGRVRETVRIWPDRLCVERTEPNGERRVWEANPYWVRVQVVDTARIPSYLILSSSGRDIELGAFLTPPERRALAGELTDALRNAQRSPG